MNGRAFIDTNIFIYLYAEIEAEKQAICKDIINNATECVTSTQILNEISNVMIRKWRMPFDAVHSVQGDVRRMGKLMYITEDTIDKAVSLHFRYGFSYYDCLMLASALESGCDIIYTEDMSDGQIIENSLRIINPFANASKERE